MARAFLLPKKRCVPALLIYADHEDEARKVISKLGSVESDFPLDPMNDFSDPASPRAFLRLVTNRRVRSKSMWKDVPEILEI